MSMRRFSVVEGVPSKPDGAGVIVGEGVEFTGDAGGGRAVVMPADLALGYPTFYASVEHVTMERPNCRVVFVDAEPAPVLMSLAGGTDQLAGLVGAPRREQGADVEP